jgi:TMEM175 potassium channel family protein
MAPDPPPQSGFVEKPHPLERIVVFSDAVMAIAITLLALDLRLPDGADLSGGDFAKVLADLAPHYWAFVLSFAVIGAYWFGHHRIFRFVVGWTPGLLFVNLLFLFFVVQLPFLTSVLGAGGTQWAPTALYAFGLAAMGLSMAAIWAHASRQRLLVPDVDRRFVRALQLRLLMVPLIFIATVPLAFVSPGLAQISWTVLYVVQLRISRRLGFPVAEVART